MELTDGKTRVLLHLENENNLIEFQGKDEVPFKICQKGIAEAVKLTRPGVIYIINNLIKSNIIKEDVRRVVGLKRRRKVYKLTQKGLKRAKKIREKIEEKKVTVKTKSIEREVKLENINSFIDSENPLLTALNNITENHFIDLTHPEGEAEDVFVGRKDELQFLQNRLEKVKDGSSSTILIKGKAGIGKTRLVNEFKNHALSEGFDFLMGKGHYDSLEPYLPFKEAFGKFQNLSKNDPMAFSYINERNKDWRNKRGKKPERNLIFSETTDNIESLAEEHSMVIFIDDLQWADKASLRLFHYLTEKLEDVPVLLICAYRSEDVNRTDFLNEVLQRMNRENLYEELELELLSWEDTKGIVQGLTGRIDIPDYFINLIHETSEGNPLFSKEFVKQMLEDGSVDPKNDKYPSKKDDIDLPEVVDDIIERRTKKLDEENLRILKIGSIIGEKVPFDLLDFVTDIDTLSIVEYVDILTGTGLWDNEPTEDAFYFTHGLIQFSVYERIPETLRKELHKRVAESIEELYEDEIEDHYSDLGFHYKHAEEFSKGIKYHRKAGDKAEDVYAHEDALEMYKEALKLAEKGGLDKKKKWKILEKLGDVNKIIGNYNASLEYFEELLKEKIELKYKQRIYRKIAGVYEKKGEFNKSLEYTKKGLEAWDEENIEISRLLCRNGWCEVRLGKYDLAREDFLKALEFCEEYEDEKELADVYHGLGITYVHKSKYDEALNYLEKSLQMREENGNLNRKAYLLSNISNVYYYQGYLDKALDYYESSLKIREKIGDRENIPGSLNNIGRIYSRKGKLEEAIKHYKRSHKVWKDIGNQQGVAVSLINIGEYYLKKGELDSALEKQEKGLEISEKIGFKKGEMICLSNIGEIYLQKGKANTSKEKYQRALEVYTSIEYKYLLIQPLLGLAQIYIEENEIEKALERAKRALDISNKIEARPKEGISHKVIGMVYREKKEWNKAKDEFEEGERILKEIDHKTELARLLFQYAVLWKDMDEEKKKREYLEKSHSMFKDMGMKLWIEKCEEELE